jgi:hypothetical protein
MFIEYMIEIIRVHLGLYLKYKNGSFSIKLIKVDLIQF